MPPTKNPTAKQTTQEIQHLKAIEKQLLWLACWTIHNANHLRENRDGIKVGGHQASCASIVSIMTALYFTALRPEDRVAVKPHASPVFHAMQYLMGNQSLENLQNFRGFGGAQSYPSRTKDADDVDFSTGSVGLGVAITAFASLVQDYLAAKPWAGKRPLGRMVALVGDAELDEGNVYEALQEGWKNDLRNCWWIIDYNRQSLDGVVREGLWQRIEAIFGAFGWDLVLVKYGALQRAAFAEPGGEVLRDWIDACTNPLYSALTYQGGAAWRKRLMDEIGSGSGKQAKEVAALLGRRNDDELAALMENLGGQCIETLAEAFAGIDHDRPVAFLAYTSKGWGTPLAGHKDNHAGLMTRTQMAQFQQQMGIPEGKEWEPMGGVKNAKALRAFLDKTPFFAKGTRRHGAPSVSVPSLEAPHEEENSTQAAFGRILDALGKSDSQLAERVLTTSPDVTVSTNLGPWVNRRGLFARGEVADIFREERIPSTQKWWFSPGGQHIELGIAEMNLFLLLAAAGLSHSLFGERLIPVGTVYDPFVIRGLDALNYACYQDARFLLAGTPSGISLAPEGGAHQSIGTPLIGMSQDGLSAFEPAYADELAVIMAWAFAHIQREGNGALDPRTWLRDGAGGSVYMRLTTRPIQQLPPRGGEAFAQGVIDGAYWWREPGPNPRVVIAYQGCLAPEAIAAMAEISSRHPDVGLLSITSADRLHAGWANAAKARGDGQKDAQSHIERLLAPLPATCTLITVLDGHPATLSWLGSVCGHRALPLGVEHFGQTGRIADLYRAQRIDPLTIIEMAEKVV